MISTFLKNEQNYYEIIKMIKEEKQHIIAVVKLVSWKDFYIKNHQTSTQLINWLLVCIGKM